MERVWRKSFGEFLVYRIAEGAMQQPSQENSAQEFRRLKPKTH
jgi:hypothetical protein